MFQKIIKLLDADGGTKVYSNRFDGFDVNNVQLYAFHTLS